MRILIFLAWFTAVLAADARGMAFTKGEAESQQKVEQLAVNAAAALRNMELLQFTCTVTDTSSFEGKEPSVQTVHLSVSMAPGKLRLEVRDSTEELLFAIGALDGRAFEYRPEFRFCDEMVLRNVVLEYDQLREGGTDETFLRFGGPGAECYVGSFLYSWVGEGSARPGYLYELIGSGILHSANGDSYLIVSSSRFEEGLEWMEVKQTIVVAGDEELPVAIHTSQATPEGSTHRERNFKFHTSMKKGDSAQEVKEVLWDLSDLRKPGKEEEQPGEASQSSLPADNS